VSIDRATRLVYLALKANKNAKSAVTFLNEAKAFYPYDITKLLRIMEKNLLIDLLMGEKNHREIINLMWNARNIR